MTSPMTSLMTHHREMPKAIGRFLAALAFAVGAWHGPLQGASVVDVIRQVQPKIAKIYGAGGYRGLEPYQSGLVISAEGHVLTVWSYVLDTDYLTVTLDDGRRFDATLLGVDPRLELALLKIDSEGLPYFDLSAAASADAGTRVLAFSNLFNVATGNEPASVQQGNVAVKVPLAARRGVYETPYRGPAYVLDAVTNNPGAAGGALTDRQGRLLGMLGKELRNNLNNTWLNYAIPADELAPTVNAIRDGNLVATPQEESPRPQAPLSASLLGFQLVPDIAERTPPYIDWVRPGSPAAAAGLRINDLVLLVNNRLVQSCAAVRADLDTIDKIDKVRITVLREQELIEVELAAEIP